MILLIKALILKYKKTVGILVITMFIVLSSLHVFNSFTNSGAILGEQLTREGAYHAKVQMNDTVLRSDWKENIQAWDDVNKDMETLIESHDAKFIKQRRESFGHLYFDEGDYERGLEDYDRDKMENQDLSFNLIPWEDEIKDSFTTHKGKDIHTLQGNEVAISRDLEMTFKTLGVDAIGYELVTYYHHLFGRYPQAPLVEDLNPSEYTIITYKIVSVVDTKRSQLLKKDTNELELPDFFVTYESLGEMYISPEIYDHNSNAISEGSSMTADDFDIYYLEDIVYSPAYYVYFDDYSVAKDKAFSEAVNLMYEMTPGSGRTKVAHIDSLNDFISMNPIVDELLAVLSKFIVSGVLVSCLYSFYIHFKNQLRTSLVSVSSLLIQGVSLMKIVSTYILEVLVIYGLGLLLYLFSIPVFSKVSRIYGESTVAVVSTIKLSLLFTLCVILVLTFNMIRLRRNVFAKLKTGGRTQLKGFKLNQKNYVSVIAWKRVFTYIQSSIGYALSIGLVVSMLFISTIASAQVRGIYTDQTFGIKFDYMIMDASAKQYGETQAYSKDYAPVKRMDNNSFMESKLDRDNSNYYRSTTVTFYNTIDAFIPLVEGKYPPDHKDTISQNAASREEALVSRRHMDRRDLVVYHETKVSSPVERAYLFYENKMQYQERAVKVYATTNTLYNNGWNVFLYAKMYDKDDFTSKPIPQYVLNLKDDVSKENLETYLDEQGLDYYSYDNLLDTFQKGNDGMNAVALSILTTILILMSSLLFINVSGLRLSMKYDHEKDDELFEQIGVQKRVINRLHVMVSLLRGVATGVVIIPILMLLYPPFVEAIKKAFGLYILPKSLFAPLMGAVVGFVLILFTIYVIYNKTTSKLLGRSKEEARK